MARQLSSHLLGVSWRYLCCWLAIPAFALALLDCKSQQVVRFRPNPRKLTESSVLVSPDGSWLMPPVRWIPSRLDWLRTSREPTIANGTNSEIDRDFAVGRISCCWPQVSPRVRRSSVVHPIRQRAPFLVTTASPTCATHPTPLERRLRVRPAAMASLEGALAGTGVNASPRGIAKPAFASVSAGDAYTCAVKTDGTVACWGDNRYGQAAPPTGTFVSVSAGGGHTCGVRSDSTIACWGSNRDKFGVFTGEATPPAGQFVAVSVGGAHACAVRAGGTIACWGSNEDGQATPPTGTFVSVSAGASHTCGVQTDGDIACWGYTGGYDYEAGKATPPAALSSQSARESRTRAAFALTEPLPAGAATRTARLRRPLARSSQSTQESARHAV